MRFSLLEVYDKVTIYMAISTIVFLIVFVLHFLQYDPFFAVSIFVSFVGYIIIMFMYLLEKPPTKIIKFSLYLYILSTISLLLLLCIVCVKYTSIPLFAYIYIISYFSCIIIVVPMMKLYTRTPCSKDLNSFLSIYTSHAMKSRKLKNKMFIYGSIFRMLLKYGFIPINIPTLSINLLDRLTLIFMFMFIIMLVPKDVIPIKNLPYNDVISLCIILLTVFILIFNGYRYVAVVALKYWFQRYGVDLKGLTEKLWLLVINRKVRDGDSKSTDLAFYRFKEFKDNIMSLELKLAYVNLFTVLEILGVWKLVKDRYVGEYVDRRCEGMITECRYTVTHNELRGALVHGARREGIDKDIEVRERLFLLDPVCPIADLLIVLNSKLKT